MDAFGLAAIDADKRREKLEKAYRTVHKVGISQRPLSCP